MSLVKWTFIGLILLPVAEIAAFVVVAVTIGWFWTVLLFIATSVIGILVLRHLGRSDCERFRTAMSQGGVRTMHLDSPGLGTILGGILLVFPGFITDLMGALLFIPPVRRWIGAAVGRAFKQRRASRDPLVIELAPEEWHNVTTGALEDQHPPPRDPPAPRRSRSRNS